MASHIPVALIVWLRDYRFLLLDTFLRFAVNFGLAAAYIGAVLSFTLRLNLRETVRSSMFLTGLALVGCCLSLIAFAYIRNSLQSWMSRVVFRRQSLDGCVKAI